MRPIDAEARIAELEKELELASAAVGNEGWISVKDRLPDKSGSYLVMLDNVLAMHLAMNVHYWNAKDGYWRGSEAHSRIIGISHWMPLPEPPKEEST